MGKKLASSLAGINFITAIITILPYDKGTTCDYYELGHAVNTLGRRGERAPTSLLGSKKQHGGVDVAYHGQIYAPADGGECIWNEENTSWDLVVTES